MSSSRFYKEFSSLVQGENARNMSRESLVSTFVEIPLFKELFSPQNHIILGARGSGKTALAKMLSHDHLCGLADRGSELAQDVIRNKSFIGIYLSTKNEWVGSLDNKPWSNRDEKQAFFKWKLNIATAKALLQTLTSCLNRYIDGREERYRVELKLMDELKESWAPNTNEQISSTNQMRDILNDFEWQREVDYARKRTIDTEVPDVAPAFSTQLFVPLKRGIDLIKRHFANGLEQSTWFLCLDEAEFLDADHHKALNTHLRADSGDLSFKITTVPYGHHTTNTYSRAPVRNGHDFEYLYIARKRTPDDEESFTTKLFSRLANSLHSSSEQTTLPTLLGDSYLLESKSNDWGLESQNMKLLKEHSTHTFYQRAVSLKKEGKEERFRNEIARKVHGLLKLRNSVLSIKGAEKLDLYSGWKMLARCGEENPRTILRLLKKMISFYKDSNGASDTPLIPRTRQTQVFRQYSARQLERTKTEENCRDELHDLLSRLGTYAKQYFLEREFTGDVVSAYRLKRSDPYKYWDLTKRAVQWGLLHPKVNKSNPNELPRREGVFHLANILAPGFMLLPRRGKAHRLTSIIRGKDFRSGGEQLDLSL